MATKVNYTKQDLDTAVTMYNELGNDGMDAIAVEIGKSVRSVRAKLVREGVYIAPTKPEKVIKDDGPTKGELISEFAALVPFNVDGLAGANKPVIKNLIAFINTMGETA